MSIFGRVLESEAIGHDLLDGFELVSVILFTTEA